MNQKWKNKPSQAKIDGHLDMLKDASDRVHPLKHLPMKAIILADRLRAERSTGPDDTIRLYSLAANNGVDNIEDQHLFAIHAMNFEA